MFGFSWRFIAGWKEKLDCLGERRKIIGGKPGGGREEMLGDRSGFEKFFDGFG